MTATVGTTTYTIEGRLLEVCTCAAKIGVALLIAGLPLSGLALLSPAGAA